MTKKKKKKRKSAQREWKKEEEPTMREYENTYYDPSHEAGYAGAQNLLRVNAKGKILSKGEKKRIYDWLSNQDAYTLHRPIKRKFSRLAYDVKNIDDVWECDLMQMTTIKEYNDNYAYLLVVVDCLSKYAWVEPLKDKTGRNVTDAFEKILKRAENRRPDTIQSDRGSEFKCAPFQALLKKNKIEFRYARNPDIKAAIVERLNRTLRERIWRYFTHNNTKKWIDVVQRVVNAYNHSVHSGTKLRPSDVNLYNAADARENLRNRAASNGNGIMAKRQQHGAKPKYRVSDYVRISRTKNTFERGYEKNFSEEVFVVKRVTQRQGIYTYVLQDLNSEEIDGYFYTEELTGVGKERLGNDQKFEVEEILRSKGRGNKKQYFVKWRGWPISFASWVSASDIEKI